VSTPAGSIPPASDPWRRTWSGRTEDDTAPQQAIDLPLPTGSPDGAARDVAAVLLLRSILGGVATLALVVAAVLLFRHGVRPSNFPAYASGTSRTVIQRYSGPWIGAAGLAALLAGLCLTSCAADVFRRVRLQRSRTTR
jgi:hypothetical protein